jgi:mono/diheme cytochrome c family protein
MFLGLIGLSSLFSLSLFAQAQGPAPTAPPTPGAPAGAPASAVGAQGAAAAQGRAGAPGPGRGNPNEPDFSPKPPLKPLSPAEEAKRFWLPPGFTMEPVLSEPDIMEPAQIAFDGNGRMFVLELRGYMQDADGGGTLNPNGRISIHEDRNNDGIYETHGVFVDNMVFPRFVMPFGPNAILAKESNADELYKFTDTNGDGKADKKDLFATGMGRLMNVEHQEAGLMWGMDNWMYSTLNLVRLKWTPTGVLREPTGSNGGQWGVTQDNDGKIWFQAGASGMPGYFQTPVAYGNFNYPEQFETDLNIIWGAPVLIADMQGGMGSVRMPDGSLARATGSAGNDVFRGDKLPADMIGDYFYGETVGRVVRRMRPVKNQGMTQLRNVYPLSEFIRSTDPLFRPVDQTTAPDGTMYITDMYRGIIQESQWSGPGTYLRQRIDQYQLDKIVRHGRIWRLSYNGMARRTAPPRMNTEAAAQLVAHLSDANGWWRDTAQQYLILKQDKSVVPALKQLAASSPNANARVHAIWTLDGLQANDAVQLRTLMKDKDARIRMHAIRASETLYKGGDRSFAADYKTLASDSDIEVVMQAMMTMNVLKTPDATATIKAVAAVNKALGVQIIATTVSSATFALGRGAGLDGFGAVPLTAEEESRIEKGRQVYAEVCFACHGEDGRGAEMPGGAPGATRAPALAASPRVLGHQDYVIKTLLHGLTGPVAGETYAEVMIPFGQNNDEWVAGVASYIRNAFGNKAPTVAPTTVARVRAETATRKTQWNAAELESSLPRQIVSDPSWKVTASHNSSTAPYALGIQPWTSGERQAPGMWLQVELPAAQLVSELSFESNPAAVVTGPIVAGAPSRTVIAGGGGRGAAPGAPAPPAPPAPPVGYPRGYQVQVSMDGSNWTPVAKGQGTGTSTHITFAPTQAKFIRLTSTEGGVDVPPLSVLRLKVFGPGR